MGQGSFLIPAFSSLSFSVLEASGFNFAAVSKSGAGQPDLLICEGTKTCPSLGVHSSENRWDEPLSETI
jgi:hypothetical protein